MRLPPRPNLEWKQDGTPLDRGVGDVYYSVEDGLAESRAVFLSGCGLPEVWQQRANFTIAELGFGTGLNFLATWQMWRATRDEAGWLNFVSFEGFPLDAADIERALLPWPELQDLTRQLCQSWPARAKGIRQITWPEERLTLTLHIGLIEETLPNANFCADAWFLDGFSPAKNQAMWEDALWPLIAARSAANARAATFTVAGAVRRGLAAAGFQVEKQPGHGQKRERLEARLTSKDLPPIPASKRHPSVAIIGAGIAGACLARTLSDRGATVSVFDGAKGPAQGTSGNPLALVMPRLDASDTVQARLLIDAYLSAQSFYDGRPGVTVSETTHRPRNADEAKRFEKVLADPPLGLEQFEAINGGGVLHKRSLILEPGLLIANLLNSIAVSWNTLAKIDPRERTVNGEPFDAVILASGWQMQDLMPELGLTGRLGQIEWATSSIDTPASAIAAGPYALSKGTTRLWGATFDDHPGGPPQTSADARNENLRALESLAPYWWQDARRAESQSRAGVRATTADRLPMIGGWPNVQDMKAERVQLERAGWAIEPSAHIQAGAYIVGGFGSRGFTWAPWAAAIISADIFGDPSPVTTHSARAILPIRHAVRVLKRTPHA